MATTTNFGWETPDDTDLVKDGAAAMRTLGNSIDTSFVDLKGGTSGQMLTKASNTDLDYTWVTPEIGDITAVVAGTGLSGGGTTGSVTLAVDSTVATLTGTQTLTNKTLTSPVLTTPTISTIDAKGDLLVGTGDNTISRIAVGSNNQVLTADSSTATGLKWAAAAGGGKVLQVVMGTSSTSTTIVTSTYTDTTLSASITPSATTSKVLVLVSQQYYANRAGVTIYSKGAIVRNSTTILDNQYVGGFGVPNATGTIEWFSVWSQAYLDSPSTTSATTYKTQQATNSSGTIVSQSFGSSTSTIILLEIGA